MRRRRHAGSARKKRNSLLFGDAVCDTYSLALPSAHHHCISGQSMFFLFWYFNLCKMFRYFPVSDGGFDSLDCCKTRNVGKSSTGKTRNTHKSSGWVDVPFSLDFVESKRSAPEIHITMAQTGKRQVRNGITKKKDLRKMFHFITSLSLCVYENYSNGLHSWLHRLWIYL